LREGTGSTRMRPLSLLAALLAGVALSCAITGGILAATKPVTSARFDVTLPATPPAPYTDAPASLHGAVYFLPRLAQGQSVLHVTMSGDAVGNVTVLDVPSHEAIREALAGEYPTAAKRFADVVPHAHKISTWLSVAPPVNATTGAQSAALLADALAASVANGSAPRSDRAAWERAYDDALDNAYWGAFVWRFDAPIPASGLPMTVTVDAKEPLAGQWKGWLAYGAVIAGASLLVAGVAWLRRRRAQPPQAALEQALLHAARVQAFLREAKLVALAAILAMVVIALASAAFLAAVVSASTSGGPVILGQLLDDRGWLLFLVVTPIVLAAFWILRVVLLGRELRAWRARIEAVARDQRSFLEKE